MKRIIIPLICIALVAAGCEAKKPQANVINETSAIVPIKEAAAAQDEPVKMGAAAMPCLQFTDNQKFLNWLDAYMLGDNKQAVDLAKSIDLPEQANPAFIQSLKMSHRDNVIQTQICTIHKELGLITWNTDLANESDIYVYYNGEEQHINVEKPEDQKGSYCLPNKITDNEMVYKCTKDQSSWKQIHINRKTGEIRTVLCETQKDGQSAQVWEGCLK